MSSKVTGDAQPDAGAKAETEQTLPPEIVENLAGAVTVAENTENTEPTADSPSTPETAAGSAPDEPAAAAEGTGSADSTEPAEPPAAETAAETKAETKAETQAETKAETQAETDAEAAPGEAEETENPAELEHPSEPAELIAMTEPVEQAEPVEVPEPRRRGHGVLIACVFVVAALAIVGGAFAIVGSLTHGFKKPVIIHYKKSAIFSLKTGECIDPNGQAATIVSCGSPHDAEVFATFSLPGSKWPGTTAVSAAASSGCSTRLTGYLNPQLAISLASTYIYPDSVAWQAGTRTVICEVRATSGQLTGSVRGASATAG
jgi:thiamine pyrophosphokinase